MKSRRAQIQKVIDAARLFCESTLAEMDEVSESNSASIPAEFMLLHYAVRELDGNPLTLASMSDAGQEMAVKP